MIDEDATFEMFGYRSTDWSYGSGKKVVAVCEGEGCENPVRVVMKRAYCDLCVSCAAKKRWEDPEYAAKMSGENHPNYGVEQTDEANKKKADAWTLNMRKKQSETVSEWWEGMTFEERETYSAVQAKWWEELTPDEYMEFRILASCRRQGIPREEFDGFAEKEKYCYKFNEECREHNREKYGRRCFLCGKLESENGNRKLSVHHEDGNKNQGCDGHDWKLDPLCTVCHGMVSGGKENEDLWHSRAIFLHKYVWRDVDLFIKEENQIKQ